MLHWRTETLLTLCPLPQRRMPKHQVKKLKQEKAATARTPRLFLVDSLEMKAVCTADHTGALRTDCWAAETGTDTTSMEYSSYFFLNFSKHPNLVIDVWNLCNPKWKKAFHSWEKVFKVCSCFWCLAVSWVPVLLCKSQPFPFPLALPCRKLVHLTPVLGYFPPTI